MPHLTLPLVVGLVAVATLVAARLALRRWPRHRSCPSCHAPTGLLRGGGALDRVDWLVKRRWCATCGWTGLSNAAPPPDARGGALGHGSGFRWNAAPRDRTGFRWAPGGAHRRRARGRRSPPGG